MKQKLYVITIISFLVLIVSASTYSDPEELITTRPQKMSVLGNLKEYDIQINCEISEKPIIIPVAYYDECSLKIDETDEIAKVFGLNNPQIFANDPDKYEIYQGNKYLRFRDHSNLNYRIRDFEPVIETYSEENMIEIAESFKEHLLEQWKIPTDVKLSLGHVAPCWTTTIIRIQDNSKTEIIRTIGVFYELTVNGVDVAGPGADFTIKIANDEVIGGDLHMPSIMKGGSVKLSVTPSEAFNKMIERESRRAEKEPDEPKTGTLIIDKLEPVYYVNVGSNSNPSKLPIFYRISGTIIKDIEGNQVSEKFTSYEIAIS